MCLRQGVATRGGFSEKLLEASMSYRVNASQLQDGSAADQG